MMAALEVPANDVGDIWHGMEQHGEFVEPWAMDGPAQWFNQDVHYADYYQDELESIVSLEDVRQMNFDSVEISDDDDDDDVPDFSDTEEEVVEIVREVFQPLDSIGPEVIGWLSNHGRVNVAVEWQPDSDDSFDSDLEETFANHNHNIE